MFIVIYTGDKKEGKDGGGEVEVVLRGLVSDKDELMVFFKSICAFSCF